MKTRCALVGNYSHRTPMGYAAYRPLFEKYFEFVGIENADVVVVAWTKDIALIADDFLKAKDKNPQIKLVVISEEPLWDTLWSPSFTKKHDSILINGNKVDYYVLNHLTSKIFDFEKIPYFITTEDHYFARYSVIFNRNRQLKHDYFKKFWPCAQYQSVFMAIKRLEERFEFSLDSENIIGLSRYRSLIAEDQRKNSDVLVTGFGWAEEVPRQELDDWHLNKLFKLDGKVRILSAIENTHQINYISEKFFDAYAIGAIPLYFASGDHLINKIVHPSSYINLYGLSVEEVNELLHGLSFDDTFFSYYLDTQTRLFELFSDPFILINERMKLVDCVLSELRKILE